MLTSARCVRVPEVEETVVAAARCDTVLEEECREARLELPKQACRQGLQGHLGKPLRV